MLYEPFVFMQSESRCTTAARYLGILQHTDPWFYKGPCKSFDCTIQAHLFSPWYSTAISIGHHGRAFDLQQRLQRWQGGFQAGSLEGSMLPAKHISVSDPP